MQNKYQVLKKYFGYDQFREGQEQLIDSILNGRDCLCVMPTGAGKSLCFQIPALMMEGISIIISPLISLMKDQVNTLSQIGVKAAYINSSLTERQIELALNNARKGVYKIIYVAPERLETASFLNFAKNAVISMLTVDEAHCISQWGQDFRPSYLKITAFLECLSKRPIVSSFTATATPKVREDIINLLQLQTPTTLVTGFNRENLNFAVRKPNNRFAALIEFLQGIDDESGIIYCATRKTVEEVCDKLKAKGYSSSRYHAGLSDKERRDNQDDFLYERVKIMVATNAFGMGIDKSNVRFVVHYNMPKNIESYYQEAGRAGRDGEPADCILFYNSQDYRTNLFLIENGVDMEYANSESEILLKERDRKRLKEMTFYCHSSDCLRGYILKYFGERPENYCGNCSNCLSNFTTKDVTIEAQKILSCVIKSGERFGPATIISILRGKSSEKITRWGLDKLSTFNISTYSEKSLRDIVNHLVLNEYLFMSNDQYSVLKRGTKSKEVLSGAVSIEMKLVEEEHKVFDNKISIKRNPVNSNLLGKLKALRSEIANEQSVPTHAVLSDSTLIDMCVKLPSDKFEMLQVSGIGQVKLERYGERFLAVIEEFVKQPNSLVLDTANPSNHSESFGIEISSEAVTISTIADRINCLLIQKGLSKVTAAKLNTSLVQDGYLEVKTGENGKNSKVPTDSGRTLGITTEQRITGDGEYFNNHFDENAQRFIIDKIKKSIPGLQD